MGVWCDVGTSSEGGVRGGEGGGRGGMYVHKWNQYSMIILNIM